MLVNSGKQFYAQEFLGLMKELEALYQDHYCIRLQCNEKRVPHTFPSNQQREGPVFMATKGNREIIISPETIRKEIIMISLADNARPNGILIRIINNLENQVQQTRNPVSQWPDVIVSNSSDLLPEYCFEVIEGLFADFVYASKVWEDQTDL